MSIIIRNFTQVTIKMDGGQDIHVNMHDMSNAARGNYVNKLRRWKKDGSKGFPPAP